MRLPKIAVSVGTKVQSKDWGRENWRALLAQMAARFPAHALLLAGSAGGSGDERVCGGGLARRQGGGPVVNLCGALTPRESAAAFGFARLSCRAR